MTRRIALALALAALVAGCARDETVQWRFALEHREDSLQHAYAQRFAELVEERSGGRVRVSIYPAPVLGSPADLVYLAQNGSLQFAFASIGTLGGLIPEAQVLLLHDTFSADEDINHQLLVQADEWQDELADAYRARHLALVGLVNQGWLVWTADRPLRAVEDFSGLRMRTMPAPMARAEYESYGARAISMPEQELYGALELNLVDGQVGVLALIDQLGLDAYQSHLIRPRLAAAVTSLISNPTFYDGLPEEDRRLVDDVIAELADEAYWLQHEVNEAHLTSILERGAVAVIELDDAEREAFRAAARPAAAQYLDEAGDRTARIAARLADRRAELEQQAQRLAARPARRVERLVPRGSP